MKQELDEMSNEDKAVAFIPRYVVGKKDRFDLEREKIRLGVPQTMERKECDSDPAIECSYGLRMGISFHSFSYSCFCLIQLIALLHNVLGRAAGHHISRNTEL